VKRGGERTGREGREREGGDGKGIGMEGGVGWGIRKEGKSRMVGVKREAREGLGEGESVLLYRMGRKGRRKEESRSVL